MQSKAKTVKEYLAELPPDRRQAIETVRQVVLKHLPKGYEEGMQYGMIGYAVPLKLYHAGYLGQKDVPLPYAALASQKNYMALYLMGLYGEGGKSFVADYKATGKKLDMGKGCVRFKSLDDLPLEVVGHAIAAMPVNKFIAIYEASRAKSSGGKRPAKKKAPR